MTAPEHENSQYVEPTLPATHWSVDALADLETPGTNRVQLAEFHARTSGRVLSTRPPTAEFAEGAVHDVRLAPDATTAPAGLSLDVTLTGWERIDYVAFGFLQGGSFHHVKRRHVEQDVRLTSTVFTTSLLLLAQGSQWSLSDAPFEVRLYIKGVPGPGGARAAVHRCTVWHATPPVVSPNLESRAAREALDVVRALRHRPRSGELVSEDARHFAATGEIALIPGVRVTWPVHADAPVGPGDNATLRYSWHALNPAARLAEHRVGDGAEDGAEDGATLRRAATEMAMAWISSNVHRASDDPRYAWYDHGSAERLLSLLIVLDRARGDAVRSVRAEAVLEWQTLEHARLLACPEFYAANQDTVFHNHAWFQDLALLVAGACFDGPEPERWTAIALERLRRQFTRLVIDEGDAAVFSENSIGYHHQITTMVEAVARLEATSNDDVEQAPPAGNGTVAGSIAERLSRWGEILRYPNGRMPSQGDTYRLPPSGIHRRFTGPAPGSRLFPTAGYGVVHGSDAGVPFALFLYNTGSNPTHKHHDNASITLSHAGIEWLVDPSFYSHDYAATVPAYLRGRWAHNALCISGSDYSTEPGLTELHGDAGSGFTFEAVHGAYGPIEVHREIRGDTDRLDLHLEDWFVGELEPGQDAEICFHLGEGVRLQATDRPSHVVLTHADTESAIELALPSTDWYTVQGLGADERSTSLIGHGFQEAVDSVTIHARIGRVAQARHRSRIRALPAPPRVTG